MQAMLWWERVWVCASVTTLPIGLRLCTFAAVLSAGAPGESQFPGDARAARPGDVELRVDVFPVGGRGVVGEPLVAALRLANVADEPVRVLASGAPWPAAHFSVWDEAGRQLGSYPPPPNDPPVDLLLQGREIRPGGVSIPTVYLLDRVCRPQAPGRYLVRASVWDWRAIALSGDGARREAFILAEASAAFDVRAPSQGDYEWIGSFLVWWVAGMARHEHQVEWPPLWRDEEVSRQAGHLVPEMLVNFADESTLPYMVQCARLEMKPWAFEAIRRIGTPRARQALELLSTSGLPAVAQAARAELAKFGESSANATQGDAGKEP